MICTPCKEGREDECFGATKHKTWCDSQRRPRGVILNPTDCHHYRYNPADLPFCPTCGKVFVDESSDQDEQGATTESVYSTDPETQRDIEDNFITNPQDSITGVTSS